MRPRPWNLYLGIIIFAIVSYIRIYDLSNTIGNEKYYLFILLQFILVIIYFYNFLKFVTWTKIKLFLVVLLLATFYIFVFSFSVANRIIILTASDSEFVKLEGKLINTNTFEVSSGRSPSRNGVSIKYFFSDGYEKEWRVLDPKKHFQMDRQYYEDYKIIENYKQYDKINVIAYESPFGLELRHFEVAE